MSDIQIYLIEADRNTSEAQYYAKKTAERLEKRELKLVELIESLGEYFNHEDITIRVRTIAYLADVLLKLPNKLLSRQQRDLLNDFILSRISNGAEAPGHCARALLALEALGSFDAEKVSKIIFVLLDHASPLVQFKQQSERFQVLWIFDLLFSKYRKDLKSLHTQDNKLVQRLLTCLDGEKDPRNLMVIFSVLNVPMVEWDISSDAQDLFEAVFNYFPITFRPPPNDPYGITAQDLKNRLRDCISSTGYFAPYSFPALLDKLDSTSANVKRDALQALQACAKRYGASTINMYSVTLWDAIKFEIMNVQEEDLADEALRVLYAVGQALSKSTHAGPVQNYLKPICKECNEHLEDTPTKQSSASGRILGAVAESSVESASVIVQATMHQLLRFCQTTDSIPRRRGLFEVLIRIVQAHVAVFGCWRPSETVFGKYRETSDGLDLESRPSVLGESCEQVLDLFLHAAESTSVNEVSFRILAVEGLQSLVLVRGLLDSSSTAKVARQLTNIIINEAPHGRDEVKAKSIDVLVDIARQKPQLVMEHAFPSFMAELPDTDVGVQKSYVPILEAFAKLSVESQVFNTIIVRLKNKLYAALRHGASTAYITSILSAILYAFEGDDESSQASEVLAAYHAELVIPLLKDIVANGEENFPANPSIANEATYDLLGRICNNIVRAQPLAAQTEICRNIYVLFRTVDFMDVPPFNDIAHNSNLTMITSTHLLASTRPQLVPHTDINALLTALVEFAIKPSLSSSVAAATTAQISLLINKYIEPTNISEVVIPYIGETSALLVPENVTPTKIRVVFAMLKALVFRMDPQIRPLLPTLLPLLSHPAHGTYAARMFAMLIAPDAFLAKRNHCKIYGIYRQRFFSMLVPLLISFYRSAAASGLDIKANVTKPNCLVALTGMVSHVSYELLQTQLEELAPHLLQSLTLEDAEIKAAAVTTISKIAVHNPEILKSHAASIISRLLDVASHTSTSGNDTRKPLKGVSQVQASIEQNASSPNSPPKARAAALACLASFVGSLREETLVPYQRQTVRRLAGALDDPKRAVRAEAVRCRAAWSGLAAADESEEDI